MSRRIKLAIACWPTYGGSGVLATELGVALAAEGHEVHLLSYEAPIRLPEYRGNLYYHRVGVPEYPLFKYPPYALALATRMAEVVEQFDLFWATVVRVRPLEECTVILSLTR